MTYINLLLYKEYNRTEIMSSSVGDHRGKREMEWLHPNVIILMTLGCSLLFFIRLNLGLDIYCNVYYIIDKQISVAKYR